jgi:hypothetical protein
VWWGLSDAAAVRWGLSGLISRSLASSEVLGGLDDGSSPCLTRTFAAVAPVSSGGLYFLPLRSIWQPHAGQTHLPSSPGIFHHQLGQGKRSRQLGQTTRRTDSLSKAANTIAAQASTTRAIRAFMAVTPLEVSTQGALLTTGEQRFCADLNLQMRGESARGSRSTT